MIPLEDNVGDIIGKAQRGLGLSDSELAKKAGADLQTIRKLREGDFDEQGLLRIASRHKLNVQLILLTHAHPDHVADLPRLREETGADVFAPAREPVSGAEPIDEGKHFNLGNLEIDTRMTWGHSQGGITYVVTGLPRPIAIVGDSLFAGSMGGGNVSYQDALQNNLEKILTLPDETIICPGHGPMTTVGEEKRHNPFFAAK